MLSHEPVPLNTIVVVPDCAVPLTMRLELQNIVFPFIIWEVLPCNVKFPSTYKSDSRVIVIYVPAVIILFNAVGIVPKLRVVETFIDNVLPVVTTSPAMYVNVPVL